MKTYLVVLCCTAVGSAIIGTAFPGNEKKLKFVLGLCILATFICPMSEFLRNMGDMKLQITATDADNSEYREIFVNELDSVSRANVEGSVKHILSDEFGISEEKCQVSAVIVRHEDTCNVGEVYITLSGTAMLKNPHAIIERVERMYNCNCFVSVE